MIEKLVTPFAALIAMTSSCATPTMTDIRTVCLRDDIGNYVIKWETYPIITGNVSVFVSDLPDSFEEKAPVGVIDVDKGLVKYITIDNITRKYFLLQFNEGEKEIVGAREVVTDNVQNFRDIGGYITHDKRSVKWGNIFRSGHLDAIDIIDKYRIDNLNLQTIVDLRISEEFANIPKVYVAPQNINIPIGMGSPSKMEKILNSGKFKKGDALLYMQDAYMGSIDRQSEYYAAVLNLLLDPNNYPVLVHCSLGIDRTGFCVALILSALGVPEETIMKDYMSSNQYINLMRSAPKARNSSSELQETVTTLLSANELFLDIAFNKIKKEYGSVQKYMEQKLNFTTKKQEQLKELMLYSK